MFYSPHTYLDLARARQQELLRDAGRRPVRRASWNGRPGTLARLAARVRRGPARPSAPASA